MQFKIQRNTFGIFEKKNASNVTLKVHRRKVAYHAPCHLRTQGAGFRGRDLIRMIPGVKPQLTMECCGHDGTYAMKTESLKPRFELRKALAV